MATFQIKIQPSEHQFSAADDQSVLDAALAAGIVLPYSCRSGACSTCKGKVVSGEFEAGHAPQQVLSAEEIEAGYTLLCQVKPRSDMVIESREVRMASDIQIRKLPARVMSIEMPAQDVAVLKLQLPAAETFRYYAGQYIDLLLKDGKRRSFSMATPAQGANQLELHVRHMPGGYFTDHVFGAGPTKMKEREILRFEGPLGSFFLRQDSAKPIIFLASGTGFAPIKAMIEQMIAESNTRPAILYWGGRRPGDLYMDELARSWQAQLENFRYVPVISDAQPQDAWDGRAGFVHQAVLDDIKDLSGYEVYACGNPAMVEAARHSFGQAGLPEDGFFMDAFTPAADAEQG